MRVFSPERLTSLLADAYHDAACSNAEMRAVTEVLENLRGALDAETDFFKTWRLLNNQVGKADSPRFQRVLMKLRDQYQEALTAQEIERLDQLMRKDPASGWREWVLSYSRGFRDLPNRFCRALAYAPLPFPSSLDVPIDRIRQYSSWMFDERWPDAYPWLQFLARQVFSSREQAYLLVELGLIQLFYFLKPAKARKLFARAEQLAPEQFDVLIGWSQYWLQQGDIEQAKQYAERAIKLAPTEAGGYDLLGDCYVQARDLSAAEDHFQQATLNASGRTNGYVHLIRLYGRAELFSTRQDRVPGLVKHILAVDPDSAYSTHVEVGTIYQQNKLYANAHSYYDQAVQLEPSRLTAYTSHGYAYYAEAMDTFLDGPRRSLALESTRRSFEKAIAVAPEAMDGYWGMSWASEQAEQWNDVLHWCVLSLEHRPEWEGIIRARMGDVYLKLERYPQAEEQLLGALRVETDNQPALDTLLTLGDDYYLKKNDRASAQRVYDSWRKVRGEAGESTYQNRVGNLHYYYSQYATAAEAYRRAVAGSPDDPVLQSNLAFALERVIEDKTPGQVEGQLDEAIRAMQHALELHPDTRDYAERLKKLEYQRGFLTRYGEAALKLSPGVLPIQVQVATNLYEYILVPEADSLTTEVLNKIEALRRRFQENYGLIIPDVRFGSIEERPDAYRIVVKGEIKEEALLPRDKLLVRATREQLQALGLGPDILPAKDSDASWLSAEDTVRARAAGFQTFGVDDYLLQRLEASLTREPWLLLDYEVTVASLADCKADACAQVRRSPRTVLRLMGRLLSLLKQSVPVNIEDLSRAVM